MSDDNEQEPEEEIPDLSQCENYDDHGHRCPNGGKYFEGVVGHYCVDCADGYILHS